MKTYYYILLSLVFVVTVGCTSPKGEPLMNAASSLCTCMMMR